MLPPSMVWMVRPACVAAILVAAALGGVYWWFLAMPGWSVRGPLPPLTSAEIEVAGRLRSHVEVLAGRIGARHLREPHGLRTARDYIRGQLEGMGYEVLAQPFRAEFTEVENLEVLIPGTGTAPAALVSGAHYDTCGSMPGADDNASGVAGLLELARLVRATPLPYPLRLVAFTNEEPPYFKSEEMGSLVHARACATRGDRIRGMISLEMLGDFRDEPKSQDYPIAALEWVFPTAGNFIAFVGDSRQRAWVRQVVGAFRRQATVPSEGIAGPAGMTGLDLSDHWSYWQVGYPALMVTDGGPFRNHRYHTAEDRPDTLDYDRFARVVTGLAAMLPGL